MSGSWMLYGANGYTGRLIAEEAVRRGERPILAGRRAEALAPLAERLGLEHRVFGLEGDVARQLDGVAAVLHAAGPFSATSAPMVDACLAARAHYLDITGEIAVFVACHDRGPEAAGRGVVLLPGVGFDVVPSDCLAALLARELPGADRLELAIAFSGPPSGGTARTMIEGLPRGGAVREGGEIRRVKPASHSLDVPFRDRRRHAVSIPWGDVATAFYSTKIPNIIVYMAISRAGALALKVARPTLRLLAWKPAQAAAVKLFTRPGEGPSDEARRTSRSQLWGRVRDASGKQVSGTLVAPEGYTITAMTAVEAVRRVVAGKVTPGSTTPSLAFGPDFIKEFDGCDFRLD